MAIDPIHEHNGQWYFWDETWVDRYGPYSTEKEARKMFQAYCENCLNYEGGKLNDSISLQT